jgi:para-nitrobenzyl esterase
MNLPQTRWLSLCCVAACLLLTACSEADNDAVATDASADTSGVDASTGADSSTSDDSSSDDSSSDDSSSDADTGSDADTSTGPQPVTLSPPAGPIAGEAEGGVRAFLGIPFAVPPIGPLRWTHAQPIAPWSSPLDATEFGPICPQNSLIGGDLTGDEDCLTLNVWTPDPMPADAPVMVWIHGGGFTTGAGSDGLYHGRKLASKGVVVVTLNYRLGALGLLAHPGLTAESGSDATSGNYGLTDQRRALEWVRDNISAFGGDPDKVTIFGESAGAFSVCYHLVMPDSAGLFDRAILQSGPCLFDAPLSDLAAAEAQGVTVGAALGCDDATDLSCLRAKTAAEVLTAIPASSSFFVSEGVEWQPIIDGHILPEHPKVAVSAGRFSSVPTMLGSNADEGTLFLALREYAYNEAEYQAWLTETFYDSAATVLAAYPASDFDSVNDAMANVIGDAVFICGARATARALTSAGAPVFLYHFTHPFTFPLYDDLGAYHSADIPFVFQNPYITVRLNAEERVLSDAIQGYWTRFAATGDPGTDPTTSIAWPAYDAATDPYLTLDLTLRAGSALKPDRCDLWDQVWSALPTSP